MCSGRIDASGAHSRSQHTTRKGAKSLQSCWARPGCRGDRVCTPSLAPRQPASTGARASAPTCTPCCATPPIPPLQYLTRMMDLGCPAPRYEQYCQDPYLLGDICQLNRRARPPSSLPGTRCRWAGRLGRRSTQVAAAKRRIVMGIIDKLAAQLRQATPSPPAHLLPLLLAGVGHAGCGSGSSNSCRAILGGAG